MQQGPVSGEVFEAQVTARVGALSVDASSVKVDRAIPDPLSGAGLRAATATFNATHGADASEHTPTPWDPGAWPPAPETPARVEMDMGAGAVQSLTGRVTSVGGGSSDSEVTVEVADRYQTLDRPISWAPLSQQMPHPDEGESQRFVSLHSMAVTNEILRHCGWYATPPRLPYCVLSVPAMGTMWPETGTLRTCQVYANPGTGVYPYFHLTEWGMTVANVDARYTLQASYTLKDRGRMELAALTRSMDGRSNMGLVVSPSGSDGVRMLWTASTIYLSAANSSGTLETIASVPRVDDLAYATIEYVSDTRVRGTLRNANGVTATGELTVETAVTTAPYIAGRIVGDQRGAGFQIAFPTWGGTLTSWERNAFLHRWWQEPSLLQVRPPVAGANCADLLAQQCVAEAATYWIDEHGVLQWWHLQELERQSNVANLTSADHIIEGGISWSHDLSSVKSRVTVNWTDLAVEHSRWSRVTLWQSRDSTMSDGDEVEEFINVPNDEVWIQPDLAFSQLGTSGGAGATTAEFNQGRRSWWGGVLQDSGEWAYGGGGVRGYLSFAIERITGATFKYRLVRTGTQDAELKTPDATASTSVSRNKRSLGLPILRGKMKYTFAPARYVAAQTGPDTAPELEIDGGWWLQTEAQAQRTADYYAARCTAPEPVLGDVDLVPFPGLQLGDIVTITDTHVARLTVQGVVVGDSRSISDGMDLSHRIAIRPLSASRNGVTWEEWGEFMNGATWQVWGASQAGKTWAQWGAAPLTP